MGVPLARTSPVIDGLLKVRLPELDSVPVSVGPPAIEKVPLLLNPPLPVIVAAFENDSAERIGVSQMQVSRLLTRALASMRVQAGEEAAAP